MLSLSIQVRICLGYILETFEPIFWIWKPFNPKTRCTLPWRVSPRGPRGVGVGGVGGWVGVCVCVCVCGGGGGGGGYFLRPMDS